MNETIPYLPGLPPVGGKESCARFDGGRLSSDGGVLLLREIERRLEIAELLGSRVRVALPSAYPYQPALMSIAGRITAQEPETRRQVPPRRRGAGPPRQFPCTTVVPLPLDWLMM